MAITPSQTPADLQSKHQANSSQIDVLESSRLIKLETNILDSNNKIASLNREHFKSHAVCALNLMSSPGSGKTTLLCSTINFLQERLPSISVSVIEGDQQTELDAERIRATGINAFQVNTGKGCHSVSYTHLTLPTIYSV